MSALGHWNQIQFDTDSHLTVIVSFTTAVVNNDIH